MAPSQKPSSAKAGSDDKGNQEQEILQAVVIADAADARFRPLTLEKPRCLLPLVNMPLIEYTLEFLAVAGVMEIFVYCNAHAEQVKDYLKSSKWSGKGKNAVKIHTVVSPQSNNVGDVMRDLDAKGLIQHDFILVSGNVVSNMSFDSVLLEHKKRRDINKDAIMTMVMMQVNPSHRSRAQGDLPVVTIDPKNSECLSFDILPSYPPKRKISVSTRFLKKHPAIQVRNDLLDCHVDVCSPEVLPLFTENFDYQDVRKDFVRGLVNSELYGKTVHVHVLNGEYATDINSTQLYSSIAKDILSRWSFPMVPDSNIYSGTTYRLYRRSIYRETDVTLSRSCTIRRNTAIGAGSIIGDRAYLSDCTVGRNCVIGANVRIVNSFIWDDVTIEDNSTVLDSIVANFAHIKEGVQIQRGSIVSFNVVVGPDTTVPAFSKITTQSPDDETIECRFFPFSSSAQGVNNDVDEKNPAYIGQSGGANVWTPDWDSDEVDDEPENIMTYQIGFLQTDLKGASITEVDYTDDDTDSEEEDEADEMRRHLTEVRETIKRAIIEDHKIANAILEINALKMACNIQFRDLPSAVIPAVLGQIDMNQFKSSATKILNKWIELISNYILSDNDQMNCLSVTLEYCMSKGTDGEKLFLAALQGYYYHDMISDSDVIEEWFEASSLGEDYRDLTSKIRKLIEQLRENEESETESSGSD